jgi:hypothetical protein
MRLGTTLAIVCGALTLLAPGALQAADQTRRVVLLFDEQPRLPGLAAVEAGFLNTLTANFPDRLENLS